MSVIFNESSDIDGLVVMKLTCGIKVPGTKTKIRRGSKVYLSLKYMHMYLTCILWLSCECWYILILFLHGLIDSQQNFGSILGYVGNFVRLFLLYNFLMRFSVTYISYIDNYWIAYSLQGRMMTKRPLQEHMILLH